MEIGHCISHVEVPTLDIAELSHACEKSIDVPSDGGNILRASTQPADQRPLPANLLCARRERPCESRAADQRDEVAAHNHSITSSARARTDGEISSPSALAVFMLTTSSYLV